MDKDLKKILIVGTHLSQFFAFLVFPLIVFLVTEDKKLKEHSREVLNWCISQCIYGLICGLLLITIIGAIVAIPGFIVLGFIALIFPIIGTIKAADDELYKYPLTIRFF